MMKSTAFWALLLITVTISRSSSAYEPCPFNEEECMCIQYDPPVAYAYRSVSCLSKNGSLIIFKAPPNVTYDVASVDLRTNLAYLPARYFGIFNSIYQLSLYSSNPISQQEWDQKVFEGANIQELYVSGMNGLQPAKLADAGLQKLIIDQSTTELTNYCFKNFSRLAILQIINARISQLGTESFAGLEQTLTELTCQNLTGFFSRLPLTILSGLKSLTSISLSSVGLKTIPANFFLAYPKLQALTLSSDNLAATIAAGALDTLPKQLTLLSLSSVNLTNVPRQILINHPTLVDLDLSGNRIDGVGFGDFDVGSDLWYLNFGNNPISNLDVGTFKIQNSMENLILTGTQLETLDLSMFAGMRSSCFVYADISTKLKMITVSDISKVSFEVRISAGRPAFFFQVPRALQLYTIYPAVETIDPKLGPLFDLYPSIIMKLGGNYGLQCEELRWMSDYALCTGNVYAGDAKCADGTLLEDYLKSVESNCTTPAV